MLLNHIHVPFRNLYMNFEEIYESALKNNKEKKSEKKIIVHASLDYPSHGISSLPSARHSSRMNRRTIAFRVRLSEVIILVFLGVFAPVARTVTIPLAAAVTIISRTMLIAVIVSVSFVAVAGFSTEAFNHTPASSTESTVLSVVAVTSAGS